MNRNGLSPDWAQTGPSRQSGVATLMMSLVLLLLLTILSFTAARVGIQQQRLAGTDMRTREVREASEAGLEYALAWLRDNKCNLASCNPGACTTNCFPTLPAVTLSSGYSYAPAVSFSMQGGLLLVASTAVAAQDNTITNTVQQVIRQTDLLTPFGRKAPPIVVDGCLTGTKGGPQIFPAPGGPAILTLAPSGPGDGSAGSCVEIGHFDFYLCTDAQGNDTYCTTPGGITSDVTGGAYLGGDNANRPATEPAAWNYVFHTSLTEAKARAAQEGQVYSNENAIPRSTKLDEPFIIYTGKKSVNGGQIGLPDAPLVIIVDASAGCPKFNGNVTVYGFIYYETETACKNNGWGGAEVYGSVLLEGDGGKFTANTSFLHVGNIGGGGSGVTFLDDTANALGSWKDW